MRGDSFATPNGVDAFVRFRLEVNLFRWHAQRAR
jgi:hypothetical protein